MNISIALCGEFGINNLIAIHNRLDKSHIGKRYHRFEVGVIVHVIGYIGITSV